jgi:hypothetical protein
MDSLGKRPKLRNEIRRYSFNWIGLTQNRHQWGALMNAVMNLRVP